MSKHLKGIGASVGVAFAQAYVLKTPKFNIKREVVKKSSYELDLFNSSVEKTTKKLNEITKIAEKKLGAEKAEIFQAHIQIVEDPEIRREVEDLINDSKANAAYAVDYVFEKYREMFASMEDSYFKERASDVLDVKQRILSYILDVDLPDILSIDKEVIVVAHDLTPSETALLNKEFVKGFITDIGGRTSHAAIMARSMEIPAVLGLSSATSSISPGDVIAIDGQTGDVEINPTDKNHWETRIANFIKEQTELKQYINVATKTKDNVEVLIEANIGNPNDAAFAKQHGCEGIGLYRSEFLYMENDHWPTEEEQYEGYKLALEKIGKEHITVIRTLDIGGDKKLSYFEFPHELNPFLGYRAIRVSLDKLNVFKTQLRALGRASIHGKLGIMFPMIATIQEFKKAKEFTLKTFEELKKEGHKVANDIQIGMMIEVPSSAVLAELFAKHSDFFSIGTNDLVQYTFACDRMSKEVAYLYQPNNPSLLRLVKMTIDGGHKSNKWVGMCGEMAGDVLSIPILLGLGLDAFSMSATSIPQARKIINSLSKKECETLAQRALYLETTREVNDLVAGFLKAKNLL